MKRQSRESVLFITLDSCRYDTFCEATAPHLKSVGPLYQAKAPGSFTYSSHAAMFMGFTPGLADRKEAIVNPKYGKLFRVEGVGFKVTDHIVLSGRNIVDGFRKKGYLTVGSGAAEWFNPERASGGHLSADFERFQYAGNTFSLARQVEWILAQVQSTRRPTFTFLNVGETHTPYYFQGAPWDRAYNPCVPFAAATNDAAECRRRQKSCLEFVDRTLAGLLDVFGDATVVVCADHGDCWGEDGLWEHGIHHEKVYDVPLLFRIAHGVAAPDAVGTADGSGEL
jgi:hypothetical protein